MRELIRTKLSSLPRKQVGAIVIVVAVLVAGSGWWFWQRDQLPEDAAYRIDGEVVTIKDVEARASLLRALYGVEVPTDDDKAAAFWRDTAQAMALSQVIDEAADEMDLSIPERNAQQATAQYVQTYFGEGTKGRDAFVAALAAQGTSEAQVRDEVGRHLLLTKLFAEVTADVVAPGADAVRAAYDERRCQLRSPEQRRISNIVVTSEDEAKSVLRALKGGSGFAEVARTRSADTSTAANGGDLGLVTSADLEGDYATAAFEAKPNTVFGPLRSSHGWNIGMVRKVVASTDPAFEAVQGELAQLLLYEAQSTNWRDWLAKRLEEADVTYADDYRPKDPLALPASMSDPQGGSDVCKGD
ncbi:peptidylprolyl isomerase [Nocardioides dubius]|uniref:Peptidylprolyl isomerase n=1 Tax=Nocardioides dubius TaxID=317019 RepID=A0ABN1TZ55_9ACTN